MTLLSVEEVGGDFKVHTAGNEETPVEKSFHSPVSCGTVTHLYARKTTRIISMYNYKDATLTTGNCFARLVTIR